MKSPLILILFGQLSLIQCYAQQFSFHSNSPFGIQLTNNTSGRIASNFFFFDHDADGDQDIFLTGLDYFDQVDNPGWENVHFFMELQENIGDKWNPQFAERSNIFEDFPYPVGYFSPSAGDLNADQIPDFIVNADIDDIGNQTLLHLIGEPGGNTFDVVRLDSSMGLFSFVAECFFAPNLVDLDLDGDLDLLMSGFDSAFGEEDGADVPNYYYARNIGTKNSPSFQGWYQNPYGLVPNPFAEVITSGDIDNDEDVDLLGTTLFVTQDSIAYINVHLNTPESNGKPLFDSNLQSPFGLPVVMGEDQFISPGLVDLNGDGDLDFIVIEVNADTTLIRYYENNLCIVETSEMSVSLCEGDAFNIGDDTFTEAGNYIVHLQGSDVCDSIVELTIALLPAIEEFLNESICEGEAYTVGNETFTASGDYTVFLIAENGCDSVVFLSLYVDVVDNTVAVNENILTATQSGASYQWINCDSGENIPEATNQSYEVLVTGNYAVNITDALDCSVVSECVHVVITSREEVALSNAITIYPNPTRGLTYIFNDTQFPVSTLTVTNLSGQMMREFIANGENSFDVSFLDQGVYFARIKVNGLEIIKKLIVI